MGNEQATNLQIVEKLLADIYSRKMAIEDKLHPEKQGSFFCKLGAYVACYGSWSSVKNQIDHATDKYANEHIKILAHGQIVANINVKHTLNDLGGKRAPMLLSVIQVFSPNCGDNGLLSRESEGLKQLQVFHGPDETMDSVINHLKDQIAHSKAEKAYRDKFGDRLSLAAKLANGAQEKLTTPISGFAAKGMKPHIPDCEQN